jgi:hypothetical protein
MDRNEKFRQKLYAQSNNKPKRDSLRTSGVFDADPYVDFVMEHLMNEMEDDEDADPNEFISGMMDNPELAIVFGKSSALSSTQKSTIVIRLIERFNIVKDFDPTPYVDKLAELFAKNELDQLKKFDKEGDFVYDIKGYFKEENFTKEQLHIIQTSFYNRQSGEAKKFQRKLIPTFIFCIFLVLIPPFFIPSFLQKMGWLSIDAGWFSKIGVGLLSLILLFFSIKQLFFIYVENIFKSEKVLLDLHTDDEKPK